MQTSTLQNVFDYFEFAATCSGIMVVKVLDVQGRIAKTIRETVEESMGMIRLNMEDLRKGKYIINIFSEDCFVKAVQYTKN